ncbi:MAG: hydrogenase maturation protease [Pseudomonadales bacterium]|nr:hydrogenase maturation protease [Pseudomonadales bacterium]
MTTTHTLIIGIGNRYRGDDAFGCLVVAELSGRLPSGVQCIEHDGEPAALMDCWQGAQKVVLIDAVSSGAQAGKIFHFDLAQQSLPEQFSLYSTHAFGVPQAIELARALKKLPPEIAFIGVEGACFDAGETLSTPLLKAKEAVITEVLNSLPPKNSSHA